MKCQHDEQVQIFCVTENCIRKTSAGCHYCLKRNHFHLDNLETLNLKQVEDLIKSLNLKTCKKDKQLNLKQLLSKYFQSLKTQIVKSLDSVCSSMIDHISHACLSNFGVFQTYKKLEAKQYKKISTQELRQLYVIKKQSQGTNLQKQQQRYYNQEVAKVNCAIKNLKAIFDSYQKQVENYEKNFTVDNFFYKRIIDLTESIIQKQTQSFAQNTRTKPQFKPHNPFNHHFKPYKILKKHFHPQNQEISQHQISPPNHQNKNHYENDGNQKTDSNQFKINVIPQKVKPNIENSLSNRSFQLPQQHKFLSLEEYRNQKIKSTEQINFRKSSQLELLNVKGTKERKLSVNLNNMNTLKPIENIPSEDGNSSANRSALSIEVQSPISKLQDLYKRDLSRIKLKNHSYWIEEDDLRKQFCIRIQDPKILVQKQLTEASELSLFNENFQWKECNSEVLVDEIKEQRFKGSPNSKPLFLTLFEHEQPNKDKKRNLKSQDSRKNQFDLPRTSVFSKNQKFDLRKTYSLVESENPGVLQSKQSAETSNSGSEQIPMTEKEVNSTVLFLSSLNSPPTKAVTQLCRSLEECPTNLSSAEYLSYLFIKENRPKQCLDLCNFILSQIDGFVAFSSCVHIVNNKAAALNLLGRFSECISFAEKLQLSGQVQNDKLYKNLADVYCSLGIYEKAIQNYKKCISLNPNSDQAHYNLAVSLYSHCQYGEALEMITQAIRLSSSNEDYLELSRNIKIKIN